VIHVISPGTDRRQCCMFRQLQMFEDYVNLFMTFYAASGTPGS